MNGIKNQYRKDVSPRTHRTIDTKEFQPWIFKISGNGSRLFAFHSNIKVYIFDGKDFDLKDNSELHVVINEQG